MSVLICTAGPVNANAGHGGWPPMWLLKDRTAHKLLDCGYWFPIKKAPPITMIHNSSWKVLGTGTPSIHFCRITGQSQSKGTNPSRFLSSLESSNYHFIFAAPHWSPLVVSGSLLNAASSDCLSNWHWAIPEAPGSTPGWGERWWDDTLFSTTHSYPHPLWYIELRQHDSWEMEKSFFILYFCGTMQTAKTFMIVSWLIQHMK